MDGGTLKYFRTTQDDAVRTRVSLQVSNHTLTRTDQHSSTELSALDKAFLFIDGDDNKKSNNRRRANRDRSLYTCAGARS
jgi:hypothetical protein